MWGYPRNRICGGTPVRKRNMPRFGADRGTSAPTTGSPLRSSATTPNCAAALPGGVADGEERAQEQRDSYIRRVRGNIIGGPKRGWPSPLEYTASDRGNSPADRYFATAGGGDVKRREFLAALLGTAALPAAGCADPMIAGPNEDGVISANEDFEVNKTDAEWQSLLSPAAYQVLRHEGTEPPGSSALNDEHRSGTFICAGCFVPLFESATKYESGTGWPSFWDPVPLRVALKRDDSFGMDRTEYHCARCGGHQGHVFDDGPQPTGKRWCNNGVALQFVPQGGTLPFVRN
jgi:peptide-methionine (R)-S-oxide reductase